MNCDNLIVAILMMTISRYNKAHKSTRANTWFRSHLIDFLRSVRVSPCFSRQPWGQSTRIRVLTHIKKNEASDTRDPRVPTINHSQFYDGRIGGSSTTERYCVPSPINSEKPSGKVLWRDDVACDENPCTMKSNEFRSSRNDSIEIERNAARNILI